MQLVDLLALSVIKMSTKNKDEKRRRQQRTAARKRKERSEYREKYKEQNRRAEELSGRNRELESGMKKAEIWFGVTFVWTLGIFVFLVLFVGLWSESVFLNGLFSLLFIGSACMGMLVFARFMSRCHFYLSLGEFPAVPCGIRIPRYFVDRVRHRYLDDVFEKMNQADVFTHCSAKQIVLTNNGSNSGAWLVPGAAFFVLLYFSLGSDGEFWTSDVYVSVLLCLICFIAAVFLYAYNRKKVFVIDRETGMITIPPVSCFSKSKVVPWQQAVVAFSPGIVSGSSRWGTTVKDYLSLTTKEDLPYATSLGFRCDSLTQYRFAELIYKYMNVEDVNDLPDIKGFEDIVDRIKAK